MWVYGILDKHWYPPLPAGLGQDLLHPPGHRGGLYRASGLPPTKCGSWNWLLKLDLAHAQMENLVPFCAEIVKISKPMLVVGNKGR